MGTVDEVGGDSKFIKLVGLGEVVALVSGCSGWMLMKGVGRVIG